MKYLIFILLLTLSGQTFSKSGPLYISSKAGNVETLIIINKAESGEIEKTALIGQLCNSYLLHSEFDKIPVFIFYIHPSCLAKTKESIYLSYDKGETELNIGQVRKWKLLKDKGLVVRIITPDIEARTILELLEFGLRNKEEILKNQTKITFGYWRWKSIDNNLIKSSFGASHFSSKIDTILKSNFEIKTNLSNIQYNWENEEFIFIDTNKVSSKELLRLSEFYQIINIDSSGTIIFDTDSSFYYIDLKSNQLYNKQLLTCNLDCANFTAVINNSIVYLATIDDIKSQRAILYKPQENLIFTVSELSPMVFHQLYNSLSNNDVVKVEIIKR